MWIAGGAVLVVLAVVGAIVGIRLSSGGGSGSESQPVASGVMNDLSTVPASTFDAVGLPGSSVITGTPIAVKKDSHGNPPALLERNGLPLVVYEGGEFCPYCAAERWSLIVALSRFGSFSGLHTTLSSSTDVYPNTRTFTFVGSSYSSRYVAFDPVELLDRNQKPLQQPTAQQARILATYDVPPYTTVSGGIPFVSFGNQSVVTGPGFSPQVLQGLSWATIAGDLFNAQSNVSQAVVGNANYITAAICQITHGQPGSVCDASFISSAQAKIASASPGARGSSGG